MILHDFTLPRDFTLFVCSDEHIGNIATSDRALRTRVNLIKKNKGETFWVHLGDAFEAIHVGDPRFVEEIHAGKYSTINSQVDYWLELHNDILPKLLFKIMGNHEGKIRHVADADSMVAKKATTAIHGGISIRARLGERFVLYAHHGHGIVRSFAGSSRQREVNTGEMLKRKLMPLCGDAHVMVMGHIHRMIIVEPSTEMYLVVGENGHTDVYENNFVGGNGIIHPDSRWYGTCGSCLLTYKEGVTTYGEEAMYAPAELGVLKLTVVDGRMEKMEKVVLPKE